MHSNNSRQQNKALLLVEACINDDVETVRKLLTEEETAEEGESFLSLASSAGNYEQVQTMLETIVDVNNRGIKGDCTPLMEAASAGHNDIVGLLIAHGADVNAQSTFGNTPLMYGCVGGHEEVVKTLLKAGANLEDHNENGHTPLMEAASAGHVSVAKILLEHGAGINTYSNEFKESALTIASYKGHLDMVRFLLEAGADQEHKTDEMHTALMEASKDGHVEVARLLLDSGAQIDKPTGSFESPLTLAACGGHIDLAKLLIERGANLEEVNGEGFTPLMEAAREGHEDMVVLLVRRGAKIKAQTEETRKTALTLTCCGGFLEIADLLIKSGADIEQGANTPLMEAAEKGHVDLVRYLLESGANVHAQTRTGDTALTYACENGHTDVAGLLLQFDANLEHESEGGRTPLMKACRAGHLCTVQFLISKSANLNRNTTNNDHTPLSLACAGGHLAVVELLLTQSADPFHKLKDNSTMLIEAAKGGHTSIVQLLLDYPHSTMMNAQRNAATPAPMLQQQQPKEQIINKQKLVEELQRIDCELQTRAACHLVPGTPNLNEQKRQLKSGDGAGLIESLMQGMLNLDVSTQSTTALHVGSDNQCELDLENFDFCDEDQKQPSKNLVSMEKYQDIISFGRRPSETLNRDKIEDDAFKKGLKIGLRMAAAKKCDTKPSYGDPGLDPTIIDNLVLRWNRSATAQNKKKNEAKVSAGTSGSSLSRSISSSSASSDQIQGATQTQGLATNTVTSFKVPDKKQVYTVNACTKEKKSKHALLSQQPSACQQQQPLLNTYLTKNQNQQFASMDIDSKTDSNHDTALTLACAGGHEELVEFLLSRGANIQHRNKEGLTPLMLAAAAGHQKVVEILLHHNAYIEAQSDRTKDTPLSLACSSGRFEVAELLLSRNANKEHRNVSGYTPLSLAASGGHVNIILLLLQNGAEINSRSGAKLETYPLMLAAMNGHTQAVELLLDMGSAINVQIETNRKTALTLACFQGRHEVVSLLLDHGANVEYRPKTGLTPLMEAASGGYVEVARVLLAKGADVNADVPSSGDTALIIAAGKGHYDFVEFLLAHGILVEVKNKKGQSSLWHAANGGHLNVVELLHNAHSDIDSQDNQKVSCLMAAFRKGHTKVVKWMVDHVTEFPSDQEMTEYISTVSDKKLLEKCQECVEIICAAKEN